MNDVSNLIDICSTNMKFLKILLCPVYDIFDINKTIDIGTGIPLQQHEVF